MADRRFKLPGGNYRAVPPPQREERREHRESECKIYISNLPPAGMNENEIADMFKFFGKIRDVRLGRDECVIVFSTPEEAKYAAEQSCNMIYKGRQLDVRYSKPGFGDDLSLRRGERRRTPAREMAKPLPPERSSRRDRSPHRYRGPADIPERSRNDRRFDRYGMSADIGRDGSRSLNRVPPLVPRRDDTRIDRPCDCEIIITAPELRPYANAVDFKLREIGLSTRFASIQGQHDIDSILENIVSQGILYAVYISHQHEIHRSITVNILHGMPQEHRNMPLTDAIALVRSNFLEYRNDVKYGSPAPRRSVTPEGRSASFRGDRTKPNIQSLIDLLARGQHLTVDELDVLIEYLRNKRSRQLDSGIADSDEPIKGYQKPLCEEKSIEQQQIDLQAKILSIFGGAPGNCVTDPSMNSQPYPPNQNISNSSQLRDALNRVIENTPNWFGSGVMNPSANSTVPFSQQSFQPGLVSYPLPAAQSAPNRPSFRSSARVPMNQRY